MMAARVFAQTSKRVGQRNYCQFRASMFNAHPAVEATPAGHFTPPDFAAPIEVDTLDQIRFASVNAKMPVSTVAVFAKAGSRYTNRVNAGAAHLMHRMTLKATENISALNLVRAIETLGVVESSFTREYVQYTAQVMADDAEDMLELLSDIVSLPALKGWEIRDEEEALRRDTEAYLEQPHNRVLELIHQEAYRGVGLGAPLYAPAYNLSQLTGCYGQVLQDFWDDHYTGNNLVVVAYGMDQVQLHTCIGEFEPEQSNPETATSQPRSVYYGGEVRVADAGATHMAVAFQGIPLGDPDRAAAHVLHALLGSSDRNPATSHFVNPIARLRTRLAASPNVSSARSFDLAYSDSGLFGVFASAAAGDAASLTHLLVNELKALDSIDAREFGAAKAAARNALARRLVHTQVGALEHVAQQVLLSGAAPRPVAQLLADVAAVTPADLQRVAKRILASQPTVAAVGDVAGIPRL